MALPEFIAVALLQGVIYLLAVGVAFPAGLGRGGLLTLLLVAALSRGAILAAPPFLSSDIYRYVWDGRVQAAGINPYRYVPADPALAPLRDRVIFPNINRRTYAHTIYPPAAEAIFLLVNRVSSSLTAMKAAMVAFEVVAMLAIMKLLAAEGLPISRVLIYAWHPLTLWEFASSGHIDAAAIAFVALALYARRRAAPAVCGVLFAGATLVKIFPMVLLPAFYRRWDWRLPAAFVATVVLAYLPYLGVGARVLGFLPGYVREEGLVSGSGFYLRDLAAFLTHSPGPPILWYMAFAAVLLGGLALAALFRRQSATADYLTAAAMVATAFTVLLSPHYPWYFAWLVPLLCFVPWRSALYLTLASFVLYMPVVGQNVTLRFLIASTLYLPAGLVALNRLLRLHRLAIEESMSGARAEEEGT